jgi:hypothetical protein
LEYNNIGENGAVGNSRPSPSLSSDNSSAGAYMYTSILKRSFIIFIFAIFQRVVQKPQ